MNVQFRGFALERGADVLANGRRYTITQVLDFEAVVALDCETGVHERLKISELGPTSKSEDSLASTELSEIEERDWDIALRRRKLIEPFLEDGRRVTRTEVQQAAREFGVETSTVYRWMRFYRGTGNTAALLPRRSQGGRGQVRLDKEVEQCMSAAIEEYYLSKRQPIQATFDEIVRLCRDANVRPPHPNTLRARIRQISERQRLKRRGHAKEASDRFEARPDEFDAAKHPLALIQIDHTLLNVMLVDEEDRKAIGRPWLTIACDVYSRMIVGFYVSLDPPGAGSVGLCLTHAILPKEMWLTKRDISNAWPCWGFPAIVHADNGREFHGKMLRRACEQHGIEIDFRVLAKPHYGAHIERLMGTLSTALETLDGATFSSPQKRGDYDSEKHATMTLVEFERWFAEYVTGVYHQRFHAGISSTPLQRWRNGVFGDGGPSAFRGLPRRPTPEDEYQLRLEFMPYVERTVQQYGVQIDDVFYYADVLRPYIGLRGKSGAPAFIFRRDPRDISVVHFWDPNLKRYAEIPYRNPTHPAISVWELRALKKRLVEDGRKNVDEEAIFASYTRLRIQQEESATLTKRVRRERERQKSHGRRDRVSHPAPAPSGIIKFTKKIVPFEIFDV